MKVLVLGGTRYFGVHMVRRLLARGHEVTIATRGITPSPFEKEAEHAVVNRNDPESMARFLRGRSFDAVCDNICYCSNDVKALLDWADCGRYVMTSTLSVYGENLHPDIKESEYDPLAHPLRWISREDAAYDEVKRQAEAALFQAYPKQNAAAVRFPYVIGTDDYTKRLFFYVEHTAKGLPMFIDNLDEPFEYVYADEAGGFLAHLAEGSLTGPVNASNPGAVSLREILAVLERKTGKAPLLSPGGDPGPYNDTPAYSINLEKETQTGYSFSPSGTRMEALLDGLLEQVE